MLARLREKLENQQYRIVGRGAAVKICMWTKRSLLDQGVCYKESFYGIGSHRCCQMTPCMVCPNSCLYCWRETNGFVGSRLSRPDEPRDIVEGCIEQQRSLLNGFPGNPKVSMKKFAEAQNPGSFAISLSGEPTMYPALGELIRELNRRKIVSFLVTNGQFPERLESMDPLPTQLYVSLDAATKETYRRVDRPMLKDYWERMMRTLELLPSMGTRRVLRITAVKGLNMKNPGEYAKLIKKAGPDWIEVKGYMWVGSSRKRLKEENMPLHSEVLGFSEKIAEKTGLRIIDQREESRVALLGEKDSGKRKLSPGH